MLPDFVIVGEIVAVDLVEARGVAAVENNADVVQFGAAVELEFFYVFGLDGENGSFAVRTWKTENRWRSA